MANPLFASKDFKPEQLASFFQRIPGKADLYVYFFERSFDNMKGDGYLSFITPSKYIRTQHGDQLKDFLVSNLEIKKFIDFKKLDSTSKLIVELISNSDKAIYNFLDLLQSNFPFTQPTNKLKKWYELEFIDLMAELEKGGAKIPAKKQGEWLELFKTEREKIKHTQAEIARTDKEIDQMVYQLYQLTPEEIAIVEKT